MGTLSCGYKAVTFIKIFVLVLLLLIATCGWLCFITQDVTAARTMSMHFLSIPTSPWLKIS